MPATADLEGRALRDLRVSVTDRCNFRCRYCMPREVFGPDHAFLGRDELLTFEEIARLVRVATTVGVRRVRLTGGEPLLRRELHRLVAMLAGDGGLEDIALTTNGSLLRAQARDLAAAGLHRVTVSLDSLRPETFAAISDTSVPLGTVLDGIAAAVDAGLGPVKVNAVVKRGVNDDQIVELAAWARREGHVLRFIEYMDVGSTNGWALDDVVTRDEILARLGERYTLEPIGPVRASETATRYRYADGAGEVGVIASVSDPFCGSCTRARLSAVGELFTCLFSTRGLDLRPLVRGEATDEELREAIAGRWKRRDDRYSELRTAATPGATPPPRVEMSYIGG